MKISQDLRTQPETKYTRTTNEDNRSFQKTLQSQTLNLKQQELQVLMKSITMQGDKLARFRTFRDLAKFKRLVKGFLQEAVYSGLDLQKSHSFGMDRQNRKLMLVKQIDEKLVELTEEIMNQEKKTVDILGLIGEIKGLLVNIYT
ncbi:YaaR family protein [Virgibacillus sp. M23]|uniref:YaaR family protein n=1 Tax=Virgibacillus sp. M23 TaxID=3079030 RepID=UPI002A91D857|nr:YaaR family protein [Virgibacillus sp. M23]MDY7045089.1 YaaR family protein [Virgibacillus sp. M23]